MVVTTKFQPIDRDLIIRLTGTPQDRSRMFADFAREKLGEAEAQNESVLGHIPPHKTFVDGSVGASEDSVRPDGVIVYEFEIVSDALIWIGQQLILNSPVGSGRDPHPGLYKASHELYADGKLIPLGSDVPPSSEYVFTNALIYSRKIEHGHSPQFPDGVYEAVAIMARARFGNSAKIEFTYRGLIGLSSGSGTLVNPLRDPTRRNKKGQGSKAYNVSASRYPCIVVTPR
jgi:hypothetical protein